MLKNQDTKYPFATDILLATENVLDYQLVNYRMLDTTIIELSLLPINKRLLYAHGQYCQLMFKDSVYKSFSIVNPPQEDGKLVFHVRISKNKKPTYFNSLLGDIISVKGPFGECAYDFNCNLPVLFLAEGIGLTAFYSILDEKKFTNKISHLIWVKKSFDSRYSKNKIDYWREKVNNLEITLLDENRHSSKAFILKFIQYVFLKEKLKVYIATSTALKKSIMDCLETISSHCSIEVFSDI